MLFQLTAHELPAPIRALKLPFSFSAPHCQKSTFDNPHKEKCTSRSHHICGTALLLRLPSPPFLSTFPLLHPVAMSSEQASPPSSAPPPAPSTPAPSASTPDAPQPPSQTALEFWRAFDLNARRTTLDEQGLSIADRQESSSISRKQLSTDTRAFRKTLTDGTPISAKDVGTMLRAYQTEIDSLTTRAKAAENSFLSIYKALYDAPDPVDSLTAASRDNHTILELREQIATLNNERGGLFERSAAAATYEQKVRDLETKLAAADARAAEETRQMLDEKQAQWMAAQHKAIEAYELREQELLHQIRLANDSSRRAQTGADDMQRQLNEARSQLESFKSARASVDDLAIEDLQRTRAEANSLRKRCLQLENRLAGRPEDADLESLDKTAFGQTALSAELASREVEVSQLKDQVTALEEVLGGKDLEKRNEFAKLTEAISRKDVELSEMRLQLQHLPTVEDYENMKRQFETLQSFQMLEDEADEASMVTENEDGTLASPASSIQRHSDTLEKRLLHKVKGLENRITKMRVELGEKDGKISELRASVRAYEDQVTDQKALISKLEEGINTITGDASGVHSMKRRAAKASRDDVDPGSTAVERKAGEGEDGGAWDWGDKHQAEGLQNIIREEPSMLDIVAGQRDRFRARTMELEDDNRKLMERIEKISSDSDSLKGDNVRLYEKLRFVQSYQQQAGGALNTTAGLASTTIDVGVSEEDDGGGVLGKYRSMYEDMVNPYTIFNRRERHKRMSEMSAPERLTLRASQKVLSTKASRIVVFFYIISLHVLVALVLGFSTSACESHTVLTKARHNETTS